MKKRICTAFLAVMILLAGTAGDAVGADGRKGDDAEFGDAELEGLGAFLLFPLENRDFEHVVGADLVFLVLEGEKGARRGFDVGDGSFVGEEGGFFTVGTQYPDVEGVWGGGASGQRAGPDCQQTRFQKEFHR